MTGQVPISDQELAGELLRQEQFAAAKKEIEERARAEKLEESKKPKKQRRLELEQKFIGRVLTEANKEGDIREFVSKLGVNWRRFTDKRHRAIWRALETLNLRSIDERKEILTAEAYADARQFNPALDVPGDDLVRGQPGSAADIQFTEKLQEESTKAIIWFERELEATDAIKLLGGRIYLRKIAEIGDTEWGSPEFYMKKLFWR